MCHQFALTSIVEFYSQVIFICRLISSIIVAELGVALMILKSLNHMFTIPLNRLSIIQILNIYLTWVFFIERALFPTIKRDAKKGCYGVINL